MKIEDPELKTTVARARAGDATALAELKAWVSHEPSFTKVRQFDVLDSVLLDPSAYQPQTRSDVWHDPPRFAIRLAGLPIVMSGAKAALPWVDRLPSLRHRFEQKARAKFTRLERELLTDERLDRRARARINAQLGGLVTAGQPIWVNWVNTTPVDDYMLFDRIVDQWLAEPVDLRETELFPAEWRVRLCPVARAADVLARLPGPVRSFLGIQCKRASDDGKGNPRFATLSEPIDLSNARAVQIGLGFRFHEFSATSPAPPPERK
jgi:hypothetical protein